MSIYIAFGAPTWRGHGLKVRWLTLETYGCRHGVVLEIGMVFTVRLALEWD